MIDPKNNGGLEVPHTLLCSKPGCFRPAFNTFSPPLCLICQDKTVDELLQLMADELTERIYQKIAEREVLNRSVHHEGKHTAHARSTL